MPKNNDESKGCYRPKAKFTKFLDDRLIILKEQDRLKSLKPSGERGIREWNKKQKENHRKVRSSDSQKTKYLNRVLFPSMANVLYFLEFIAKHPELQNDFDDALKDLVGYRYDDEHRPDKGILPPLSRLIDGFLGWNYYQDKNNFRLVLIDWMQDRLIQHLVLLVNRADLGRQAGSVAGHDMARIQVWTELLARSVQENREKPSRPVKF